MAPVVSKTYERQKRRRFGISRRILKDVDGDDAGPKALFEKLFADNIAKHKKKVIQRKKSERTSGNENKEVAKQSSRTMAQNKKLQYKRPPLRPLHDNICAESPFGKLLKDINMEIVPKRQTSEYRHKNGKPRNKNKWCDLRPTMFPLNVEESSCDSSSYTGEDSSVFLHSHLNSTKYPDGNAKSEGSKTSNHRNKTHLSQSQISQTIPRTSTPHSKRCDEVISPTFSPCINNIGSNLPKVNKLDSESDSSGIIPSSVEAPKKLSVLLRYGKCSQSETLSVRKCRLFQRTAVSAETHTSALDSSSFHKGERETHNNSIKTRHTCKNTGENSISCVNSQLEVGSNSDKLIDTNSSNYMTADLVDNSVQVTNVCEDLDISKSLHSLSIREQNPDIHTTMEGSTSVINISSNCDENEIVGDLSNFEQFECRYSLRQRKVFQPIALPKPGVNVYEDQRSSGLLQSCHSSKKCSEEDTESFTNPSKKLHDVSRSIRLKRRSTLQILPGDYLENNSKCVYASLEHKFGDISGRTTALRVSEILSEREEWSVELDEGNDAKVIEIGVTASCSRHPCTTLGKFDDSLFQLRCQADCDNSLCAKKLVLQRCSQRDVVPFKDIFGKSGLKASKKIGEGVYGEVFLCSREEGISVMKVIPIEGTLEVNGEQQKKYGEILSEIIIAMELSNLRHGDEFQTSSFTEVIRCSCVRGRYPDFLINLWNKYHEEKGSENDSPTEFQDDQQFVSLEFSHGGTDLESFQFTTAEEALSVFWQLAHGLAVAEKALEFEHRDLHWGNVLVSRTDERYTKYKFYGSEYAVQSKGVQAAIIDFTLSRMFYNGCYIFNNLALDPDLFVAKGDYQFDIYRHMRDWTRNEWKIFQPYTNVLWLHYIVDKLLKGAIYKRKNLKSHKHGLEVLGRIAEGLLSYSSAFDFVMTQEFENFKYGCAGGADNSSCCP